MELNFDSAYLNSITKEEILSKISEYDIFRYYCHNFKELEVAFCSELRKDNNPSCYITAKYNNLIYKDFGNGESYTCFDYVAKKFNSNYFEALTIIGNDFSIRKSNITLEPRILLSNDEFKGKISNIPREKSIITILEQPFTIFDYKYWQQYGISLEKLEEFDVFSAKQVYLIKGNKRITFSYNKNNPCFAYRFNSETGYSYKIYWPLSKDKKHKWLFSGGSSSDIEGYSQLPLIGNILILTKSLKDVICYNIIGYNAISLQGEGNKLEQSLVDKLLKRFNKIIINYDNDERGIIETNKLVNQYKFDYFYIPNEKDISDYTKKFGIEETKKMIENKLK